MDEKTNLLPSAPVFNDNLPTINQNGEIHYPQYKIIIMPGLEFDGTRKYRYGMSSLMAAFFILIAFLLVELRDCEWGPGIDLTTLQRLHICLTVAAATLYLLSLFGIADFTFRYKLLFYFGFICVLAMLGLMIWTTYEAVVNPCVRTYASIPLDISLSKKKNVFTRNDVIGILVFISDFTATVLLARAAHGFYKRY